MTTALKWHVDPSRIEAGVDEAGRGCLAGPVFAAAVIWSDPTRGGEEEDAWRLSLPDAKMKLVRDSKTLSERQRAVARDFVESEAWAWGVGMAEVEEIDRDNILKATLLAMRRALDAMIKGTSSATSFSGGRTRRRRQQSEGGAVVIPQHLLVDGERFTGYHLPIMPTDFVTHSCIIEGDKQYVPIAAASILAKTRRDEHVTRLLHPRHPEYGWDKNKGYGTKAHLEAIATRGACEAHRKKFLSGEGAAGSALNAFSSRGEESISQS